MSVPWNKVRLELTAGGAQVHSESGSRADARLVSPPSDMSFLLVWAGRGRIRVDERALALRPGVIVIARPGRRYEAEQESGQSLGVTSIRFDPFDDQGAPIRQEAELPPQVLDVVNVPYVDAVTRRVVELSARNSQDPDEFEGRGIAVAAQLFAALVRDLDEDRSDLTDLIPGTERRHAQLASEAASRINESPQDVAGQAAELSAPVTPAPRPRWTR